MVKVLLITVLTLSVISSPLLSQEICNNEIDDDWNGLIDIQDPLCLSCYEVGFEPIEEDFEEHSCCPSAYSDSDCISGGWQLVVGTPDYYNNCGFLGTPGTWMPPLPIPSGDGCVGFVTGESIGTCLDASLLPGETYDIGFYVGYNDAGPLPSTLVAELTLYGSTNCSNFSLASLMCAEQSWFEIATFSVVSPIQDNWVYYTSSFSLTNSVDAIAITHTSCDFDYTSHFIDNIIISGNVGSELYEEPEIFSSGNCIDGVYLTADVLVGTFIQWYLDGNPITGANTNPYLIDASQSGVYQVSALYGAGCNLISEPFTVEIEIDVLEIQAVITDLSCVSSADGAIELSISSPNTPYAIDWSNGDNTEIIDNLIEGTYTVTVTDSNGCYGIMDYIVESPNPFINSITVVQGDMGNPGSAVISSMGGALPYTYLWSNGNTTNEDDNLSPGTYSVTATDANDCQEVFEFMIDFEIVINTSFTDVSCFGNCDGTISLTVNGNPDVDYSVTWDDVNMEGFNPDSLCAGTFSYLVSDEEGSTVGGTVTVSEFDQISISAIYSDFICSILDSTDIILNVNGGAIPYMYSWTNGSTNDSLFNVGYGNHTVIVTDNNGCTVDSTFVVDTFPAINLSFTTTLAGCNGVPDGTVDLTVSGGIDPYIYQWSNGSITEDLIDLAQGIYTVTVTGANNCTAVDSVLVNVDAGVQVSATISNVNCPDLDDGSILLDIIGDPNDYSILWNTASDSNYIFDLAVGNYSVTITTTEGCTWNQSYVLSLNSDLSITAEINDNQCFQGQEGSIDIQIANSNSPYTILWNNGSMEEDLSNTPAGTYDFLLIDSFGCEYNYVYEVTEGLEMVYTAEVTEPGCGASVDSINIIPTAGSFPFSYLWSTGEITNLIYNIQPGEYFVTITDTEGCIKLDTFLIAESSNLEISETTVHNLCYGDDQGEISLNISGEIAPYEVLWSTSETTTILSALSAGEYFVTITDALDCSINQMFTVNQPDSLEILDGIELPHCFDDLGLISIEGFGGTEPYSILWSTGAVTSTINIEPGNIYDVILTDVNNCSVTLDFSIEEILEIDIDVLSTIQPGSSNDNGEIVINVSGGTFPYQIVWDDGQIGSIASGLGYGIHIVNVTDANGCMAQLSINLDYEPLSLHDILVNNLCFGECNGTITLAISNGILPYTITWSDGQTTPNATDLCNGIYQATIIDATGTEIITKEFDILSPTQINIDGQVFDISCVGIEDGQIGVNASGGSLPFEYSWDNGMTSKDINSLSPGTYQITVIDENDCINSSSYTLEDIPQIDLELGVKDFNCGEEFTSIEVIGNNIYNYPIYINDIEAILDENDNIINLGSGTYTLSYLINENCEIYIDEVEIINPNETQINLNLEEVDLQYGEILELTLEITSEFSHTGFSIDWNVLNYNECAETYEEGQCKTIIITAEENEVVEVTFTDAQGCIKTLTVEIRVDDSIDIFIPNVFSPNGDGINDIFEITSKFPYLTVNRFMIFDRWGNTIYSQQNIKLIDLISWNGMLGNKEVIDGVYVYIIEFSANKREPIIKAGDITVIK